MAGVRRGPGPRCRRVSGPGSRRRRGDRARSNSTSPIQARSPRPSRSSPIESAGRTRRPGRRRGIGVGGVLEYLDLDQFRRVLEVDVTAQVAVTQAVLPLLRRGGVRSSSSARTTGARLRPTWPRTPPRSSRSRESGDALRFDFAVEDRCRDHRAPDPSRARSGTKVSGTSTSWIFPMSRRRLWRCAARSAGRPRARPAEHDSRCPRRRCGPSPVDRSPAEDPLPGRP